MMTARGNGGRFFEQYLQHLHMRYREQGRARIDFIPTPTRARNGRGGNDLAPAVSPLQADPDLALVLLPDGWLTHGALVEAARIYLRCSGEWGPVRGRGEEVTIRYWVPRAERQSNDGLPVFLHPDGERICEALPWHTACCRGGWFVLE